MTNEEIELYIKTNSGSLTPEHFDLKLRQLDDENFMRWKAFPLDLPLQLAKEVLQLREKLSVAVEALEEIEKNRCYDCACTGTAFHALEELKEIRGE